MPTPSVSRCFSPLLACLLLATSLLLQGCFFNFSLDALLPPDVAQVTYRDGNSRRKVAIVDISGPLVMGDSEDSIFNPMDNSVVELAKKLAIAKDDPHVEAVILRIDSPGGGVTASDIMYQQVLRYKEETGDPVYVSMVNLAASGGYYVAMAGDEIYAHPTTVTGSIGVIAIFPEVKGLMDKLGIEVHSITSGDMKDAGAFYHDITEEELELYQGIVDDLFERFVTVVQQGRPNLAEEQIRQAADGRVFTAEQARELGLVDGVAYLDDVIDSVAERVGDNPQVVIITRTRRAEADTAYASAQAKQSSPAAHGGTQINMLNLDLNKAFAPPHEPFQYLWVP